MKPLLFLLFFFYTITAVSQQVVVANEKENIVYCGVNNPLSALIEGYPCQSVVLTTSNGKITKRDCGRFSLKPTETGSVKIKIWIRNRKTLKEIKEIIYRSKSLPLPVAFINLFRDGRLMSSDLKEVSIKSLIPTIIGIRAALPDFDYDAPFQIVGYTVEGLRNKRWFFKTVNDGAVFNASLSSYFNSLQSGDRLLISNIICRGPDEIERKLQPLEFTIID